MKTAVKIIGLTGNIATGKSVVRRMLANSGALGIDADDISHRVLYPSGPAFQPVIDAFGTGILSPQGEISRAKLGEIVFNDQHKLRELENLIHPWVTKSVEKRIQKAITPLVVIEAIKLLESVLIELCDSIWVSQASEIHQMNRLEQKRQMSHSQALERISAQPSQSEKVAAADVVINTEGTFKNTWESVQKALNGLNDTIQIDNQPPSQDINNSKDWHMGSMRLFRNKVWGHTWEGLTPFTPSEVFRYLGTHMILPLLQNQQCKSLIFWDNWDFTGTMSTVFPVLSCEDNPSFIFNAFQRHAQNHQCEFLLLPDPLIEPTDVNPKTSGYSRQAVTDISYPSWRAAAKKHTQTAKAGIWTKIIAQPIETKNNLT